MTEIEKAVLLMAEILDILVDRSVPNCEIDDECEYYNECRQMTKMRDINSKLQRLLVFFGGHVDLT